MVQGKAVGTASASRTAVKLNTSIFKKPWTRLDAYIFSEITGPFLGAMLVYNGIFFLQIIAQIADLSSSNFQIPFGLYLLFFLSSIPEILVITVAMSFLFAALTAIGRMSVDSEIIAPQSLGISFWRMSRPILAYGFMLTLLLSATNHWIGPWLNREKAVVAANFAKNFKMPNIQQGIINTFGTDTALYVKGVEEGRLAELFIVNESAKHETMLLADRASIYTNRELELFRAVKIDYGPELLDIMAADELQDVIPAVKKFNDDRIQGSERDRFDTLTLMRNLPKDEKERLRTEITIWQRFWSPFVCIIFALFAVPLAAKHSRMRKSAGFGFSLIIIGAYFFLTKVTSDAASAGKAGLWLLMSGPPILFLLFGIALQIGKNGWWAQRIQKAQDATGYRIRLAFSWFFGLFRRQKIKDQNLAIANRSARTFIFPSKLDAYVTRSFFSIFVMVQLSLLVLLLLVEYTQVSKAARINNIPGKTLLQYLAYKAPEMLDISMFLCMLIATLLLLAMMSKNLEVTAVRAAGGSLQRLCLPLIAIGFLGSIFGAYMSNGFVPKTNRKALALRNFIRNKSDQGFSTNQWLKNNKGDLVNFKYFDEGTKSVVGLKVYNLEPGEGAILERTEIPRLAYQQGWHAGVAGKTWRFSYKSAQSDSVVGESRKIEEGAQWNLHLELKDLSRQKRRASEFSIPELRQYLKYIRSMGAAGTDFQTELYAKQARPLMPLIMMLLAMPLGFHFGRRGSFYGVALGLIAGLVFWGLFEFVKTLGENGIIHPIVAGWSVVTIAGFIALYRFINLKE